MTKKTKVRLIALIAFLIFSTIANAISIRTGIGQIFPEDENFEYYPTHFFGEFGLDIAPAVSAHIGARYIFFGKIRSDFFEESVDNAYYDAYPVGFQRRINGLGTYLKAMVQPKIGENTKIAPYGSLSSGFHFVYPTVKMIYNCGEAEETVESVESPATVPFAMASAGLEIILQKIGIFAQANYIKSAKISYEPFMPANDIELSPGGEVDPSGIQVFIGVSFR
ncbi:MAG: hypothetical protein ACLFSQ_09210 [Candidatus Zixiibacteriota bacterium]